METLSAISIKSLQGGGSPSGGAIKVGTITNSSTTFPTQRPDGTALRDEDYVVYIGTPPKTIGDITFLKSGERAFYDTTTISWVLSAGNVVKSDEVTIVNSTDETLDSASTQNIANTQFTTKIGKQALENELANKNLSQAANYLNDELEDLKTKTIYKVNALPQNLTAKDDGRYFLFDNKIYRYNYSTTTFDCVGFALVSAPSLPSTGDANTIYKVVNSNNEYELWFYQANQTKWYKINQVSVEYTEDLATITNPKKDHFYAKSYLEYSYTYDNEGEDVDITLSVFRGYTAGSGYVLTIADGNITIADENDPETIVVDELWENVSDANIEDWVNNDYLAEEDNIETINTDFEDYVFFRVDFDKYMVASDVSQNTETKYNLFLNPTETAGVDNFIPITSGSGGTNDYDLLIHQPKIQGSSGIRTLAGTTNLRDIGYLDGNDKLLLQQDIDSKGRIIELTYNSTTERLNVYLKDKNDTTISSSYVDLILEGLVVAGSYDSTNKNIELELKDVADPLIIPLGDLVDGLLETTDEANKIYGTDENGEQHLYSTDDLGGKKTTTFTIATGTTQYMITNALGKTNISVNVYNAQGNEIHITPNVRVGSISLMISQEAAEFYNGATFTVVYG